MIRIPFQSFRSDPAALGDGFSAEFVFDGERLECQWSPAPPQGDVARALLPAYRAARAAFLAGIAKRLGGNVACLELS